MKWSLLQFSTVRFDNFFKLHVYLEYVLLLYIIYAIKKIYRIVPYRIVVNFTSPKKSTVTLRHFSFQRQKIVPINSEIYEIRWMHMHNVFDITQRLRYYTTRINIEILFLAAINMKRHLYFLNSWNLTLELILFVCKIMIA